MAYRYLETDDYFYAIRLKGNQILHGKIEHLLTRPVGRPPKKPIVKYHSDNQVRLQLFALAYNLGNFLRRLALPKRVREWSLRTLRVKSNKIGAKVVKHSMYVIFQMAEVLVSKRLFQEILDSSR